MRTPPKYVLDAIIKSLRENPDEWKINGYSAEHTGLGAYIWLENRYYATELKVRSMKWGGQAVFGWLQCWRRKLCKEVDKISEQRFKAQIGYRG